MTETLRQKTQAGGAIGMWWRRIPADRRRRLIAFSRDAATPSVLYMELTGNGGAYTLIDEPEDEEFMANWPALRLILAQATKELTRQEMRSAWPDSFPPPSRVTLWRWLGQAVERGWIQRTGSASRNEPFRYFLAEKAA